GSSRLAGRTPPLSLSRKPLGAAGPGRDRARHPAGRVRRPRLPWWQNRAADGVSERISRRQASWLASDIDSINTAITLAMQDRRLNNVVGQFFDRGVKLTCDPRPLLVLEEAKPVQLDEPGVQRLVQQLVQQGKVSDNDLGTTIFNLLLPPGTILKLNQDTSIHGLGGYHGSVD